MNEKEQTEKKLETLLRQIEFPGENREKIDAFLKSANIPKRVVDKIFAAEERRHRIKVWTIIAICAFGLLIVLGANHYITEFLVFFQSAILLFISVALMAICLTGVIGIIMNIDKQKIEEWLRHSGEKLEAFLRNLFHTR